MKILTYIVLIFLLILGVTFSVLNATSVQFNYYVGVTETPLSLLMVLAFALGCFLGLFVGFIMYLRVRAKNGRLKHRMKLAETELFNLRNMPLQDNR